MSHTSLYITAVAERLVFVEAEADLLGFLRRGGGARRLQRWDLQVVGGHRLGIGDHTSHMDGEVGGFSEGETLSLRRRRWRGWHVGLGHMQVKASSALDKHSAVQP